MKTMTMPVILTRNHDGYYLAEVPSIRGFAEGKTREEALNNIRAVICQCLLRTEGECECVPNDYVLEQVEVTF